MSVTTTLHLKRCLERLQGDDPSAKSELLSYASRRLELLADRIFSNFRPLHPFSETDDLLQETMIRLLRSPDDVEPPTIVAFMGLAALQMRRSLSDMARKQFGQFKGLESNQIDPHNEVADRPVLTQIDDQRNAPGIIMSWPVFHDAAAQLPYLERTAFDLIFYHGLPRIEVGTLMNLSVRQVARYWQSAR